MFSKDIVKRSAREWIIGGRIEVNSIRSWLNVGVEPAVGVIFPRTELQLSDRMSLEILTDRVRVPNSLVIDYG